MINHFAKGIDLGNKNLTRNLWVWLEYLCWCIQAKMDNNLYYPKRLRYWWYRRFKRPIYHPPVINKMWRAVKFWFRDHTGGRSHRCEFTDKKRGALYGGAGGPYISE